MSISEYTPPDSRYRDLDVRYHPPPVNYYYIIMMSFLSLSLQTKSTYTLDARSEFGAILPQIGFNDHEIVEGRKVECVNVIH